MLSKLELHGYGGGTGANALPGGLNRVPTKKTTARGGVSLVKAVAGWAVPRKTGYGVGAEALTTGPASNVRVNSVTTGRNVVTEGPGGEPGAGKTCVPAVVAVVSSPSSRNPKIEKGPVARLSLPEATKTWGFGPGGWPGGGVNPRSDAGVPTGCVTPRSAAGMATSGPETPVRNFHRRP